MQRDITLEGLSTNEKVEDARLACILYEGFLISHDQIGPCSLFNKDSTLRKLNDIYYKLKKSLKRHKSQQEIIAPFMEFVEEYRRVMGRPILGYG